MKSFRLREMEQYIIEQGTVSMEELKNKFNISMNTTRLDVATLVSKGSIRKVYGGVCSNQNSKLIPFEERESKNVLAKKAVCKAAAALVEEGDSIYIDSGTTTMYLLDYLECHNITILTNNLNAINRAIPMADINVICLPGNLDRKTNSFVSTDTIRMLEKYNIKKAFMASTGIAESGTIMNSSPLEYEIKKAAIMNSQEVYLMIDSTKYRKSALLTYADITDMSRIIVDDMVDQGLVELCNKSGVEVTLAPISEKQE